MALATVDNYVVFICGLYTYPSIVIVIVWQFNLFLGLATVFALQNYAGSGS
ncbi:hypothetical protein [Mesotoga sp. H07.pep.5.3]|uniref:hypothetical protein n=1 Tax=Mesotoga sp. H07.pep.5.3 TaxID=1421003 RepID=UPI00211F0453|nr:hypothetical protein [Mesotoga sp. H07.pep.5.3]